MLGSSISGGFRTDLFKMLCFQVLQPNACLPSALLILRFYDWFGLRRSRGVRIRWGFRRHLLVRKPRQQLIAHRQLIDTPGYGDRIVLYIVFEDAFVCVEVGVPGVCSVLDRILTHADAGRSGLIKKVLSEPPRLRLRVETAPTMPSSLKGFRMSRRMSAASGGPNAPAPRTRPVPESILKPGLGFSNAPKCSFT